jgi:site-specific DNA recombinase
MPIAAIYARVSSDKQREESTIASQTAALIEFARSRGYQVTAKWVFEDEGYSGASLVRPGLERLRDLAAEGQIEAVLVHAPDRLSRKYAYQVLLIEELGRHGVETIFIKAPQGARAEDQLLVQFRGMIAEYERAQILERSRRGERHRAHQGQINVLSGAPYSYRYVRKCDDAAARYEILDAEAAIVRMVYKSYVDAGMSIGAIARQLNERGVPTRKQISRWERSTFWAMLRNPAYKGTACFGKTETAPRQPITRSLRMRGGVGSRDSAHHERPRADWIEIAVPTIVADDTFMRAQEMLAQNKTFALRWTIEPSTVQGLVSCRKCGYAMSRTSTRWSARKIRYYRWLGSDAWRHLGGPVCDNRPVRQDLLDRVVWTQIVRLLGDPSLIQNELDRRLAAARTADPARQRESVLHREVARTRKSIDRLLTAYQEELLPLDELRRRMPELRQREHTLQTELQAILDQVNDRAVYLRLAETLSAFLAKLRSAADTLDIQERQRVVRLIVKEILIEDECIIVRHSIPVSQPPDDDPKSPPSRSVEPADQSYLLRSGRHHCPCGTPHTPRVPCPSSTMPTLSHVAMRRRTRLSATRCSPNSPIQDQGETLCPVVREVNLATARSEPESPMLTGDTQRRSSRAPNPPNRHVTDPYARWCRRAATGGVPLSRLTVPSTPVPSPQPDDPYGLPSHPDHAHSPPFMRGSSPPKTGRGPSLHGFWGGSTPH